MGRVAHIGPLRSRFSMHNWLEILLDLDVTGSKMSIFHARTAWRGLFFDCAIYWGSLFSDRNAKTGPVGARIHVEGSNSVQKDIFTMREDPRVGPKGPLGPKGPPGPKGPLGIFKGPPWDF